MKALVLDKHSKGAEGRLEVQVKDVKLPGLKDGQVLVKLSHAALNHRDVFIWQGKYPIVQTPCILGSDGCGVVEDIQDPKDKDWLGKTVIINPAKDFNPKVHSNNFFVLGMPHDGTFAEYVAVEADRLHPKPEGLSPEEAAALPLAGVTAYRALFTQGQLNADMKVLITGIGGGVAQLGFQFAHAVGAQVYVTSGSDWKLERVYKMGAAGGTNYNNRNWRKQLMNMVEGFDLIVDGAGGDQINALVSLLEPSSKLVIYGKTLGDPSYLKLFGIFWNHLCIQGTTMGSDEDFSSMLSLVKDKRVSPVVDSVSPFEEIIPALIRMREGKQFGKIVVEF